MRELLSEAPNRESEPTGLRHKVIPKGTFQCSNNNSFVCIWHVAFQYSKQSADVRPVRMYNRCRCTTCADVQPVQMYNLVVLEAPLVYSSVTA